MSTWQASLILPFAFRSAPAGEREVELVIQGLALSAA